MTWVSSFSGLNDGRNNRDGGLWLASIEVVVYSTRVTTFSGLDDGLRLTRYDGFRERFIPLRKTN